MNGNKEAKALEGLLEKLESDKQGLLMRSWFNPLFWFVCAIILLSSFSYYEQQNEPLILIASSIIVGILIGAISIAQNGEKSWPLLKKHINTDSVKSRINELNT